METVNEGEEIQGKCVDSANVTWKQGTYQGSVHKLRIMPQEDEPARASSPAIFQRTIKGVRQGIPHVTIYLDDVLVTGRRDDVLVTGRRDDVLVTGRRDDVLVTGRRDDVLVTGRRDDVLVTGRRDDVLVTGRRDDVLVTGRRDDVLVMGRRDDVLVTGRRDDVLVTGRRDDVLVRPCKKVLQRRGCCPANNGVPLPSMSLHLHPSFIGLPSSPCRRCWGKTRAMGRKKRGGGKEGIGKKGGAEIFKHAECELV
uniref:uncharacterized protein LOC124034904 n=1 Tax=Oncorhynchus gorbuscha TaxID=8017 RepID=UPI001EAE873A|nr:uncharacterized protein LOC124034904 [Oncorhynchus gorbuscha]